MDGKFGSNESSSESDPFADSSSEYVPSEEEKNVQNEKPNVNELKEFPCNRPKKRVRKFDEWKRNKNKKKKCAGQEYETSAGKIVYAKTFQPHSCTCKNVCMKLIPEARQHEIHTNFYKLESINLQNAYLFSLIKVCNKLRTYTKNVGDSKRQKTRMYYLSDSNGIEKKVCKEFFQGVLQVSAGKLDRLLKSKSNGSTPPCDRRGKHPPHNKTTNERKELVKGFIEKFPSYESHYTRQKSCHRRYLAPDLSLGKMYDLYKNEINNPVSYFVFREIFNKEFNLHFHAPITDSCKKYDLYNIQIKSTLDNNVKKKLETEREFHQRKAQSARDGLKEDVRQAKFGQVTVLCFDLMKTLPTPVLTTGICYYKRQLWTYCMGIHNMSNDDSYMYLWNESLASRGPQEIGSCLLHYIKTFVKSTKIILYSDQCGGQNRNIKMSLLCNYIVSSPDFEVEQIDHKFLVSGHSYLPCDQDFGIIEKEKKFHSHIFAPKDWYTVIRSARKKNPFKVIEMESSHFFSTKPLESNIINRKISESKTKVEWFKIQWLRFEKQYPFKIQYKYSNTSDVHFETVDISKRKTSLKPAELPLLYPNGNVISDAKKKDLFEVKQFIPPIFHLFYDNLRSSSQGVGGELLQSSDED